MSSLHPRRWSPVLALLALPAVAKANSCPPPSASSRIAYPDAGKPVGRACSITVDNPDTGDGRRIPLDMLTITSGGKPLPFKISEAQAISGKRYNGCNPNPLVDPSVPVPYRRYLVTPDDPLPPLALVEVMAGPAYPVARFMTTDQLDRQNCDTAPAPFGGICQPPLQDCIADAAAPNSLRDAAVPNSLWDVRPPGAEVPVDGPRDAADDSAPPDAAAAPTDTLPSHAPPPVDAGAPADLATTTTKSSGCSAGGPGSPPLLLVPTLLMVLRRVRTSPAQKGPTRKSHRELFTFN